MLLNSGADRNGNAVYREIIVSIKENPVHIEGCYLVSTHIIVFLLYGFEFSGIKGNVAADRGADLSVPFSAIGSDPAEDLTRLPDGGQLQGRGQGEGCGYDNGQHHHAGHDRQQTLFHRLPPCASRLETSLLFLYIPETAIM